MTVTMAVSASALTAIELTDSRGTGYDALDWFSFHMPMKACGTPSSSHLA